MTTQQARSAAERNAALMRALAHPLRARVITRLYEAEATPKELSDLLDPGEAGLKRVCYHIDVLRELGVIELVDVDCRRGGKQHIYRATVRPVFYVEAWERLPLPVRELHSALDASKIVNELAQAHEAGVLDARVERGIVRVPMVVDGEAFSELERIAASVIEQLADVQARACARLQERGETGIQARAAFLSFEAAPSTEN